MGIINTIINIAPEWVSSVVGCRSVDNLYNKRNILIYVI